MMGDLSGKIALVTGASKPTGIGYAIAIALAEAGADVAVCDLGHGLPGFDGYCRFAGMDEVEALAEKIRGMGRKSLAIQLDVTSPQSIAAMAEKVKTEFGRLDILCNNAGAAPGPNLIEFQDIKAWHATMDTNLHGTFFVTRALLPLMKNLPGGATIVNTASRAGKFPKGGQAAYCVAKAALIMLTKVMALEFAPYQVRVNAVCPGQIETDMRDWGYKLEAFVKAKPVDQVVKDTADSVPLKRIGKPSEVAELVAFLAGPRSSYMTGQAINVTGGQLMEL
jgi:NAD(P)-dependent dehydrogenase (short-subunit alcohol dehydrogenase family)